MGLRCLAALACSSTFLLLAQRATVENAWKLAANGQRAQAIQILQQEIEEYPHDVDARLLLGSLLSEAGKHSDAIAQLTEAVRLQPQSAEAQNALGEAYNNLGDTKAARAPFEKAVELKPSFAQAQVNLGLVLLQAGESDAASVHLDRAIALFGHNAEAAYPLYLRAKLYSARNETQEAASELERAVALRPDLAEAWSDLGQARKVLLDDRGALHAFERAVNANPDDAVAQYRLGSEYLNQEKLRPAIEHLQRAYRLNPQDQSTLNSLQTALRRSGDVTEANRIRQELTALLRDKDRANQNALQAVQINNQGASLEKAGKLLAASEKYREALELYPQHVGIRVNYAVALLRLGQWTEGLNELHEALRRDPANSSIKAALKDAISQAPPGSVPKWNDHGP